MASVTTLSQLRGVVNETFFSGRLRCRFLVEVADFGGVDGRGHQVTYAGHPLYLYDQPSVPFAPEGEGWLETVYPLPPWHGLWDLVSARNGLPAPGQATIETETLPDGKTAIAAEEYPNFSSVAVSVYSFSRDHAGQSACSGACAVTWIPVLTTGAPQVTGGIAPTDVGTIRRPDGTDQVTYGGQTPLPLLRGKVGPEPGGSGAAVDRLGWQRRRARWPAGRSLLACSPFRAAN